MKPLLIVLLLATAAWGNTALLCVNPKCDDKTGICECQNIKGHCPHCGAKGVKVDTIEISGEFAGKFIHNGELYLCPNKHIYWEKD